MRESRTTRTAYASDPKTLATGILDASSGNISLRTDDQRIFVTPSGIDYDDMEPLDLIEISLSDAVVEGNYPPSSEWPPRNLQGARDAEMVIHSRPLLRQPWRVSNARSAFSLYGGALWWVNIPCLPYRPIGGEELAQEVATTLRESSCLSHGTSWNGCRR